MFRTQNTALLQKILLTVVLITITFSSCKKNKSNQLPALPESVGKLNSLTVIAEPTLWKSSTGSIIKNTITQPVEGLPVDEPIFEIFQYPTSIFDGMVNRNRNILYLKVGKKNTYFKKTDQFAKPQNIHYIIGKTIKDVERIFNQNSTKIIDSYKTSEQVKELKRLSNSLIDTENLSKKFQIDLPIGFGYRKTLEDDNFLWLRKEFKTGYNCLLFYNLDKTFICDSILKPNKDQELLNLVIKTRDSIGKKHIKGTLDNTWMVTQRAYAPYFYQLKINNQDCILTKGIWELKNDYMAGSFINFIFKHPYNDNYLAVEGFTYNPTYKKRDLMFELETIIRNIKFLKKENNLTVQ